MYQVNLLFDKAANHIRRGVAFGSFVGYRLIIETNKGVYEIEVIGGGGDGGGGGGGGIDEIIDYIEDIEDETLDPTPTPPHTPIPTQYHATPTPPQSTISPNISPSITPSPSPTLAPGEPTPLPEYMTRDPFTCDDVYQSGKPITVSNIHCGFNEDMLH